MPCNLAVSITKAAVEDEQLTRLLTPEVVKTLIDTFMANHRDHREQNDRAMIRGQSGVVDIYITRYNCWLTIRGGEVEMSSSRRYKNEANTLVEQIAILLQKGAEQLFDQQIAKALKKLGQVSKRDIEVDNQGAKIPATLFTLEM